MNFKQFFTIGLCVGMSAAAMAQSPISGFMNGKNHGAVAVSFSSENYTNVFLEPSVEADGVPVFNEVAVQSVSIYGTYGISDRLDAVVGLPYISAKGDASATILSELGFENKRSGVQDVSLFLKYNPFEVKIGSGDLDFIVGLGVKTPAGNYKTDEGLQSIIAIGNRATSANGLAIAQYKAKCGVFVATQAGYSLRNNDVPNAVIGEIKVGYASTRFFAEAYFAGQTSDGGTHILGEGFDGDFTKTDVTYNRAGLNIYVPIAGGFGVSAGASKYLNGRNIGESTGFSGSLVYSF